MKKTKAIIHIELKCFYVNYSFFFVVGNKYIWFSEHLPCRNGLAECSGRIRRALIDSVFLRAGVDTSDVNVIALSPDKLRT